MHEVPPGEICPTCNRRVPKYERQPVRICRNCEKPIKVHHKWRVVTDGEASWIEHRHCADPEQYVLKGTDDDK